jgi:YidC/Oxa1 family membrane protein insertase
VVGVAWWQASLEGLGSILAFFYELIPNYGVDIILLTLLVRVVLLPLTVRQVRAMRSSQAAMRRVQPKIEALKKKYKGNRQRFAEEQMKVYREEGVNPAAGCLPILFVVLQAPVFIALFSVLRGDPNKVEDRFPTREGVNPAVAHLPDGSSLAQAIQEQRAGFLGMNLTCATSQAGRGQVDLVPGEEVARVNCGSGILAAIPFYVLIGLMVLTTWYQQKQMQTTASSGVQAQQMQMMGRIMPLFLGVFSYSIPAGVVMYWVTTNAWQIGQQQLMLPQKPQDEVESRPAPKSSGGRSSKGSSRGSRNAGSRKKRPKR